MEERSAPDVEKEKGKERKMDTSIPITSIPPSIPCTRGCHLQGGQGQIPVIMRLDEKVYHFRNTGSPYMLRHCPKCDGWALALPPVT